MAEKTRPQSWEPRACENCDATGQVMHDIDDCVSSRSRPLKPCPRCGGTGEKLLEERVAALEALRG